ncbi:putative sugar transporter protein [Phaeoacremonium minimum UCRPA7]|uniref:Putative sugar transporter protein n=1 Tax=Phaeoacremonium minimum (strain UCR-PA7) TaxID=1286976 RepID=R8B8M2_PHAM7|nr:putative sugar transporter protein [Phaeoacremonium minimum UCRPA7]EON95622.1 putative sugar transporter protein [Phaeoacremonium minimum UCRPA7]
MVLMTLWCGQNIITFYFSSILNSVGVTATTAQTGINGGLNIINLISSIIGAILADRIGRRKLWLTSYIGMIVIFVPFIALSAVYATKGSPNEGYTTEIMPFYMRSRGLAIKNFVGQIALIINMYVNPIALAAIGYYYYIVFLALNCMWLVLIYLFFPETKGYSLEELSMLFDSGDSVVVLDGKDGGVNVVVQDAKAIDSKA